MPVISWLYHEPSETLMAVFVCVCVQMFHVNCPICRSLRGWKYPDCPSNVLHFSTRVGSSSDCHRWSGSQGTCAWLLCAINMSMHVFVDFLVMSWSPLSMSLFAAEVAGCCLHVFSFRTCQVPVILISFLQNPFCSSWFFFRFRDSSTHRNQTWATFTCFAIVLSPTLQASCTHQSL